VSRAVLKLGLVLCLAGPLVALLVMGALAWWVTS
jgi:hypothetical protein